jgi:hypothetical protein
MTAHKFGVAFARCVAFARVFADSTQTSSLRTAFV